MEKLSMENYHIKNCEESFILVAEQLNSWGGVIN